MTPTVRGICTFAVYFVLSRSVNINDLHNSAEPLGPEQSPTNHPWHGIYFIIIIIMIIFNIYIAHFL